MAKNKKHLLITAGGTREYIDTVRFISNESTGKMGYALARAAQKACHKVTLISASDLQPPVGVDFIGVDTAAEMFKAVKRNFDKCDCLIMAAAVADYTPARPRGTKIKKSKGQLILKLKPTKDILAWAGKHKKKRQCVVGFALEDKNLRTNAARKLRGKNLDMIIANTCDAVAADKATVHIKSVKQTWQTIKEASKEKIAQKIVGLIENSAL